MNILGISCYFHDSAAALVQNGKPVFAMQEERFSRVKNDSQFPRRSILAALAHSKSQLRDLDAIVFYEKPLLKLDRQIEGFLKDAPWKPVSFADTFSESFTKTLFMRNELLKALRGIDSAFDEKKLLFSEHHLSHAASAFFPSPFSQAVILTLDGLGEWSTTTVSIGDNNTIQRQKEIHFPHSLGLFYSTLTTFCGFKVNSGEYKLMGLAPYGKPEFFDRILNHLIFLQEDGSFQLNGKYFDFSSAHQMFTEKLVEFFGVKPRIPESFIEPVYMDIAASAQAVLNHALIQLTRALHKEYGLSSLCLSGGVALNCVSNSQILRDGFFKNLWIQPASGDAGSALGAALAAHSLHFQKPRFAIKNKDSMSYSYLGTEYSNSEIQKCLDEMGLVYETHDTQLMIEKTCHSLIAGAAVGWFQGRSEFGPRALGSRSILADARSATMQEKLNLKIKFRESFRPFAPIVLAEKAADWFTGCPPESPYMLFVADVLEGHRRETPAQFPSSQARLNAVRSSVPAITHLDYSARLQTVTKEQNLLLHELLQAFDQQTGFPILVNTSFNVRGEPIVESPRDAILCFLKTDLDLLVMGSFVLEKQKNLHKIMKNSIEEA
jgi:carbamoyltransferase